MTIGESLQKVRLKQKFTQQEVANKLYVTRQTISRWEKGKTIPNIYALKDLAKLYGVTIDELIESDNLNKPTKVDNNMKKTNWFAVFGLFWFNVMIGLAVILSIMGCLLAIWLIAASFTLAPLMLVGEWLAVILFHLPWPDSLGWYQVPIAFLLWAIGWYGFPYIKSLSVRLGHYLESYVRYNWEMIYYNTK